MDTLIHHLNQLKLAGVRQALKQQQTQPALYQELSFEERLCLLLVECGWGWGAWQWGGRMDHCAVRVVLRVSSRVKR